MSERIASLKNKLSLCSTFLIEMILTLLHCLVSCCSLNFIFLQVVEGYTKDLIDLYHYRKWMKEPASHAIIELISALHARSSNADLIAKVANDVITPTLFLHKDSHDSKKVDLTDRAQWLKTLTPEQIAIALHLQTPQHDGIKKFDYPLDEPLVTGESIPTLSTALASTSSVVHPRCHAVWNALWMYLTEEGTDQGSRQLRANEDSSSIIEKMMQHVVVDILLGKGEQSATPTNERRSLALQIVCALCGSSELNITLPSDLIQSVLCPDVVTRVFVNVLGASGGAGKKKAKEGSVDHHLKPLTSQALLELIDCCCKDNDIGRRMAFVKAIITADPRFDTKTKTQTVTSLLMLENDGNEVSEETEKQKEALWQQYLSFLEEEIVSATSLHSAMLYIELMYKLAKRDLTQAPANEARRVVRFFMTGAFFDCSDLSDPSVVTKSAKKKKKGKTKVAPEVSSSPPPELSSGLRIKEILRAKEMNSISHPARAIMSARFYSLLSDFIAVINSQSRGGNKNKAFYGKGSRPESIYRALSEVYGIISLLETSGAKQYQSPLANDTDDSSDGEDPMETTRELINKVKGVADEALVNECSGSGDEDILRAKSVFATGCASLMMSLSLQLHSCGKPDASDDEEEDEEDDVTETVHEYISDLAECVDGFCKVIEDGSSFMKDDEEENPLAAMAGLLVNILSSQVGGEDSGKANPIQASASKLTRETVKLAWSGIISVITGLSPKNTSLKNLVDEDVMSILIESVCGEKSMEDKDNEDGDDESSEESESSEDGMGDSGVFVDASNAGMDLDEVEDKSEDSKESNDEDSQDSDDDDDDDIELDSTNLENMLLEDSDADLDDKVGILEHHAGADKALAQLIKLKQEARKASQTERERVDLCNRLRCASLLDSLFTVPVFKGGWLPAEAVLGSIVPILRSRKTIAKSIEALSPGNANKSLSQKNALIERLSALVKDKISKFRCSDQSEVEEVAMKAVSDIYEEMKHSLNAAHCSCCSVALITAVRCIPKVEENNEVKGIYLGAVEDWSSRKATKIHASVFDGLIQRMPRYDANEVIALSIYTPPGLNFRSPTRTSHYVSLQPGFSYSGESSCNFSEGCTFFILEM